MVATVNLGPEYDEALQQAVLAVLNEMKAEVEDPLWELGGSQEVVTRRATVNGCIVTLQSETYIGLTVTGEAILIEEIARRTGERSKRS